jgi:hypothetical protein
MARAVEMNYLRLGIYKVGTMILGFLDLLDSFVAFSITD